MTKKKETKTIVVGVDDVNALRDCLKACSNPMEKMMAVNLFEYGIRFIPQYKIDCPDDWKVNGRTYFIADFYVPSLDLVIETDGKIHNEEENIIKDKWKDNTLSCMGYAILRLNWEDVMSPEKSDVNWIDFVLELQESREMTRDAIEGNFLSFLNSKKKDKQCNRK